jgi:FkbM family methyltransferase
MNEVGFSKVLAESRKGYEAFLGSAQNGIYLYGAGFVGSWAVGYFEQRGIPVHGFVDSDERKRGQTVEGKPIYCLSDFNPSQISKIIISSRHAVPAIKERLTQANSDPISVDAFVVHHEYPKWGERVVEWLSHDDKSLGTFWAVLVSMLEGRTRALAPFADSRPFFDRFGFFNRDGEIFVDAGAYVGDSLERFIWSVNGVFREIHAFEPGKVQFKALGKRVNRLREEWAFPDEKVKLNNKALSATDKQLNLTDSDCLIQSRIVNYGLIKDEQLSYKVEGITLDSYAKDCNVTFIKVDVEGQEKELLEGASNLITRCRPRIALSVYHFPTDIFELPDFIKCLNSEYQIALGHHSSQLMDTVLYCRDKNDE